MNETLNVNDFTKARHTIYVQRTAEHIMHELGYPYSKSYTKHAERL